MQHWTDYWQNTNALNSFAEGEQAKGYQKDIAKLWEQQLENIQNNATIVDLGTGNGAVAVLSQELSNKLNKNWNIIGLDAAGISPSKLKLKDKSTKQLLKQIQFIPNTPIEKLPFEDNSVDVFISQFAFEYSDISKSLKQCLKCLKSGGKLSFICHTLESHISEDSLIGERALETVLLESPAFMQTDLLLDIAQQQERSGQMRHWQQNPYRQNITATLHWIFDRLSQQFKSNKQEQYWCNSTIKQITNILKNIGSAPASQLRTQLQTVYKSLDSHRLRLKDQNAACLNEKKLEAIKRFCDNHSLTFAYQDLNVDGKVFGALISMTQ